MFLVVRETTTTIYHQIMFLVVRETNHIALCIRSFSLRAPLRVHNYMFKLFNINATSGIGVEWIRTLPPRTFSLQVAGLQVHATNPIRHHHSVAKPSFSVYFSLLNEFYY